MKPLLVGDMPTRGADKYWQAPLSGGVAKLLSRAAGMPQEEFDDSFDFWNANKRHQAWDLDEAARRLGWKITASYEVVILLGRRVQAAYCEMTHPASTAIEDADFYEWNVDIVSATGRRQVMVLPAPVALKRSDDAARSKAGALLRESIEKAREMEATRL